MLYLRGPRLYDVTVALFSGNLPSVGWDLPRADHQLTVTSVLNGASFTSRITPGAFVTIKGTDFTAAPLSATTVPVGTRWEASALPSPDFLVLFIMSIRRKLTCFALENSDRSVSFDCQCQWANGGTDEYQHHRGGSGDFSIRRESRGRAELSITITASTDRARRRRWVRRSSCMLPA